VLLPAPGGPDIPAVMKRTCYHKIRIPNAEPAEIIVKAV